MQHHDRDSLQRTLLRHYRRGYGSPPHPGSWFPGSGLPSRSFGKLRTGLAHELTLRGIRFEQYKKLPVTYKGVLLGDYEADPSTTLRTCLVVEDQIILELKAVSAFHPAHEAKAHHYLAATGLRLAILINFGADSLEHQRVVK